MYNFCHSVNTDTKLKCVRAQFSYTQPVHSHRKWKKKSKFTAGLYTRKDLLALLFSPFHLLVTELLRYITFSPYRKGTVYMSFPRLLAMDLRQNATFSSSGKDIVYRDLHRLLVQEFVSIVSVWTAQTCFPSSHVYAITTFLLPTEAN